MIGHIGHLLTISRAQHFNWSPRPVTSDSVALEFARIRRCLASMKPRSLHLPFGMLVLSASGQSAVFPALAGTGGPSRAI